MVDVILRIVRYGTPDKRYSKKLVMQRPFVGEKIRWAAMKGRDPIHEYDENWFSVTDITLDANDSEAIDVGLRMYRGSVPSHAWFLRNGWEGKTL